MARKISGPVPGSLVAFEPTFGRDPKDATPVRVFVKAPTEAQRRENIARAVRLAEFAPVKTVTLFEEQKRLVEIFVERVENYVDAADTEIRTAGDLWERGEQRVVAEVVDFVQSLLVLSSDEAAGGTNVR